MTNQIINFKLNKLVDEDVERILTDPEDPKALALPGVVYDERAQFDVITPHTAISVDGHTVTASIKKICETYPITFMLVPAIKEFRIKLTRDIDGLKIDREHLWHIQIKRESDHGIAIGIYPDLDEDYGHWDLVNEIWEYTYTDYDEPFVMVKYNPINNEWIIPLYTDKWWTLDPNDKYYVFFLPSFPDTQNIGTQYPYKYKSSEQYIEIDAIPPGTYEDTVPYFDYEFTQNPVPINTEDQIFDLGDGVAIYRKGDWPDSYSVFIMGGGQVYEKTYYVVSSIPYYVDASLRRNLIEALSVCNSFKNMYHSNEYWLPEYNYDTEKWECVDNGELWAADCGDLFYSSWYEQNASVNFSLDGQAFLWLNSDSSKEAVQNLVLHQPTNGKNHSLTVTNSSLTEDKSLDLGAPGIICANTFNNHHVEFENRVMWLYVYPDTY